MREQKERERRAAEELAQGIKARCEDAAVGRIYKTKTLDEALDMLLEWARELTADVERSRSLLALASFLVGNSKRREKIHAEARQDPLLALKCEDCNADQDAWGSTCVESVGGDLAKLDDPPEGAHHDACGWCDTCPDCTDTKTWVRPDSDERLSRGMSRWEKKS